MDVKLVMESSFQVIALGLAAAIVSWFSFWIKETLSRRDAYRKFQNNPFAKAGAKLNEWRDVGNRQVIGECWISSVKVGRVVLETPGTCLVLTIQEFQAGHAFWAEF